MIAGNTASMCDVEKGVPPLGRNTLLEQELIGRWKGRKGERMNDNIGGALHGAVMMMCYAEWQYAKVCLNSKIYSRI